MNHWLKLIIPLFLGIVAAIINAGTVKSKLASKSFVRVTENIEPGQRLTGTMIERIELSGDLGTAAQTLVPWEHKAVLLNRPATGAMHAGDPVYWRDFAPVAALEAKPGQRFFSISLAGLSIVPEFIRVGTEVDFILAAREDDELQFPTVEVTPTADSSVPLPPPRPVATGAVHEKPAAADVLVELVGPFHVAAVGKRITPGGEIGDSAGSDERVLTIATSFENGKLTDKETHRLLAARSGLSGEQVIGIVLSSGNRPRQSRVARPVAQTQRP